MELIIDNITKQYGSKFAVDGFGATLNEGIYALLGANGSGKTTLMRMICDLLRPTSGEVLLDGVSIDHVGENYRELLGYLPQNFGFYPNFSGWDFMIYLASLKGLPKHTAHERSEQLLKLVGLYEIRRKKLKTYSGGMRQRIGIAQALLNNPKILILDEPTSGLDPKERTNFRNLISEFSKGRIVILSTHIVSDVEYIADEILMMKNGKLIVRGNKEEVCNLVSNKVWDCRVLPAQVEFMTNSFVVSRLHQENDTVHMRIVSDTSPSENAEPVSPGLEDLYLYYFREEEKK